MAKVLLLTNTLGASAEVLPALGLLQHQVKILPAEASVLVDAPEADILLIDARRDLPNVKSFAKLLDSTGVSCPIIAITTEGGLTAFNADWGIDDVILDTAGPAEVDARIRIALGKHAIELVASDPHAGEIRTGEVTIDESTGVAIGQEDLGIDAMKQGFWLTGFGVYIFWNFFTLLGALGAQAMVNPSAWGLDAAVPAAFLGLVWPRLTGKFERTLAASAVILAILLSPIISAGLPIIATALLAVAFGWRQRA